MCTKRHLLLLLLLLPGALAATGCGRNDPVDASVELGTGEWRFEPLEDGQEVELVRGSQGGWHVWVSVRARDLKPEDVLFRIESQVMDADVRESVSEIEIDLEPAEQKGTSQFLGWPAVQARPECVHGHPTRLRVILTGASGATAIDERIVTPIAPPGTEPPGECDVGG